MVLPLAAEATETLDPRTNAATRLRWAVAGGLGVIAIGLLAVIAAAQREP
jgi:CHASE1-domain containing sensor protein